MGDVRKVQEFVSSLGDAVVVDSGKHARPRHRVATIAIAAAVLFALAAAAALYKWYMSYRALNDANLTISELVEATSETVQSNTQLETVDALLEKARKAINTFAASSNDPRIVEQRARTYLTLAQIDFDRGRIDRMQEDALVAFAKFDSLAKSGNVEARHLRAQTERLIGTSYWERGNNEEAKLHYDRGISDLSDLVKQNVDPKISWPWMRSLADLYQSLGDVLLFRFNQREEALAAFNKARDLRERLVELGFGGPALEFDLAWITNKRAEAEERLGNTEGALALFTEAYGRVEALKEKIWDNLRWAADFGTIEANIGRLKRKQNRFAEAAPVFARAEETLSAVSKRDPKNVNRSATLNWVRYLRAENLSRLALQNNDRIRLLAAREQTQQIIATTTELAREAGLRTQAQLNKVREEALLAAIDANLRQLNGNFESAALGFIEASDIIENGYLKGASKTPWPELLRENIEYLESAGMANVKARKAAEAQALFKRALEMLVTYRRTLGEKEFEDSRKRIEARFDRGSPPADRAPPAITSAPPVIERAPPAVNSAPLAADHAPGTTNSIPPGAPPVADRAPAATNGAPPSAPSAADHAPPAEGVPPATEPVSPPPQ